MIKVVGIVTEYNPFHNGHKMLSDFACQNGYTHCISVMSGNFVQRSVPAITEKRVRTKAALCSGVDLVLELPVAKATATAQHFALGAMQILKNTGVVDAVCFGTEQGEIEQLREISDAVRTDEFSVVLPEYLEQGMTFAAARSKTLQQLLTKEHAAIASEPNNLLAIEYIGAAKELDWDVDFITLARQQVAHDSSVPGEDVASASYIRDNIENIDYIKRYVPDTALEVYKSAAEESLLPSSFDKLEIAVLSHLRRLPVNRLRQLPDISEGIENRFYSAIQRSLTLEELYANMKSKRYTHSRMRRLVLTAFLGISEQDVLSSPEYIRFLGFNEKGAEILSVMKDKASLPFSQSLKELSALSDKAKRVAELEALSTDIYTLSLPTAKPGGYDFTAPGIFLR